MCTSHVCAHRTLQRVPLNTRYTFKQSSMFNGVGINCLYVAMCTCRCVHRTIKRSCDAIYEACCTGSKCCSQMLHQVQSNCRHKCCAQVLRSCANTYCLPFCAHHLSFFLFFTFHFFHVYIIERFFTCPLFSFLIRIKSLYTILKFPQGRVSQTGGPTGTYMVEN